MQWIRLKSTPLAGRPVENVLFGPLKWRSSAERS
jgi:hypothetical protein